LRFIVALPKKGEEQKNIYNDRRALNVYKIVMYIGREKKKSPSKNSSNYFQCALSAHITQRESRTKKERLSVEDKKEILKEILQKIIFMFYCVF
jgi:hypothetical protein